MLIFLYLAILAVLIVALARGLEWLQRHQAGGHRVGVLEVFTAILAISTCVQVWAFIQSERAFIAISGIEIIGQKFVPDAPMSFALAIQNSGRSTAFISDTNATTTITDKPMPESPQYQPWTGPNTARGPVTAGGSQRATFTLRLGGEEVNIPASLISSIQSGSHRLFVFGFIKYRDDFSIFGDKVIGYYYAYNRQAPTPADAFQSCGLNNYIYSE